MNINLRIKNLLKSLSANRLDLKKIKYQMDLISSYNEKENFDYLQALLEPEKIKGVRLPSQTSIPSTTFQFKTSRLLQTNGHGCLLIRCNPFFLAQESLIGSHIRWLRQIRLNNRDYYSYYDVYLAKYLTSFFYYNSNVLDGVNNTDQARYSVMNIGQILPNDVYNSYRLVSACMNIKYIGEIEESSGVIGGSIITEEFKDLGSELYYKQHAHLTNQAIRPADPYNPYSATISGSSIIGKYSQFDILRDAFYHTENNCLDGLRMLYFPLDNSYEHFTSILKDVNQLDFFYEIIDRDEKGVPIEISPLYFYCNPDYYRSSFNWFAYCQGLPAYKECVRVDLCFNFECMPTSSFLDFCPVETRPYAIDPIKKKQVLDEVKKYAVGKYK